MKALESVLQEFVAARDLEQITEDQYARSLHSFQAFLGRKAKTSDLTVANVNAWIKKLQASKSPTTCCNYKTGLLVLWNWLAQAGTIKPYHKISIRTPKKNRTPVYAWTTTEIRSLMSACDELQGSMHNGIRAGDFLKAWILLGFETGLRPSDIRLLTIDSIDFQSLKISVVQHKTGVPHIASISQGTAEVLRKMPSKGRIFPLGKTGVRKWEQKLFKIAEEKFGFVRKKRYGLGTLRKSHATQIFSEHGIAAAAQSLGHSGSIETARRHYVDCRVVNTGSLPNVRL